MSRQSIAHAFAVVHANESERVSAKLGRVLFTQDDDLLVEAARRQETGERFAGLAYEHQLNVTIGECIAELELIAERRIRKDR